MGIIQNELDCAKETWNAHRIRLNRHSEVPAGVPNVLYEAPQLSGKYLCRNTVFWKLELSAPFLDKQEQDFKIHEFETDFYPN